MKKLPSLLLFTITAGIIAGGVYIGVVYAINSALDGWRVAPLSVTSITLQDNSCRKITNSASPAANDRFIPTRTMVEWNAFSAAASGLGITIENCTSCPSGYFAISSGLNAGVCVSPLRGPIGYQAAWDDCISVGASIISNQGIFSGICAISGGCGPLSPTSKIAWWGSDSRDWYNVRACDTAGCHTGWGTPELSLYPYWDGITPPALGGILPYAPGDVADGTHYYWCGVPAGSTYSWSSGAWGACSLTCGGGTQTRAVTCVRNDGITVADGNCNIATKPTVSQSCNTQICTYTSCKGTPTTYNPAVAATYTQAQGDTACVTAWGSGYKWASFMEIGQPSANQVYFNNLYINWANAQAPRPAGCTTVWGGINMYFMMLPGGWIWSQGYSAATNIFDPNYSGGSNGSPSVSPYYCSSGTPTTIPLMCCK